MHYTKNVGYSLTYSLTLDSRARAQTMRLTKHRFEGVARTYARVRGCPDKARHVAA